MSSGAKRYSGEKKLNLKKVFAVIIALAVIIMVVVAVIKLLNGELITEEKAVGIILLENENGKIKINPIIWVKTVDTLYYETACGSGSLATAIYKKYAEGIEKIDILQPSGYSININLKMQNDYIKEAVVQGKVLEEE